MTQIIYHLTFLGTRRQLNSHVYNILPDLHYARKTTVDWKEANVIPILKEEKNVSSNHMPVSLTVVTCKILEHVLCSSIPKHLEEHRFFTDT